MPSKRTVSQFGHMAAGLRATTVELSDRTAPAPEARRLPVAWTRTTHQPWRRSSSPKPPAIVTSSPIRHGRTDRAHAQRRRRRPGRLCRSECREHDAERFMRASLRGDLRPGSCLGDRRGGALEQVEARLVVGDEDRAEEADRRLVRVDPLGRGASPRAERLELVQAVVRPAKLDRGGSGRLLHAADARARRARARNGGNPPCFDR